MDLKCTQLAYNVAYAGVEVDILDAQGGDLAQLTPREQGTTSQ
jgi:hypothetical protein